MLDTLKTKIRGLIEDNAKSDFEIFEYENFKIFTISEPNIVSITKVLKNGATLGSGDYSYDSTTNKIEITASLTSGDKIEVDYTYTKYSDTELDSFIVSSLTWIGIFSPSDFEIRSEEIQPIPTNKEIKLIAIVASILIKPDWSEYRLPNMTVRYPREMTKEKKIEVLVMKFNSGLGVSDTLDWA